MSGFNELAKRDAIERTMKALKGNGIETFLVKNGKEARELVLSMLPKGAEVMMMSSMTLVQTGIAEAVRSSKDLIEVKGRLAMMKAPEEAKRKREIGAAPDWTLGSVHAVTEDGKVMVASQSGSQLPAYSHSSPRVIWVVSTKKIVKELNEAWERVSAHVLPLENERALKVYGSESYISKLLIINREIVPGRLSLIFVEEDLGF